MSKYEDEPYVFDTPRNAIRFLNCEVEYVSEYIEYLNNTVPPCIINEVEYRAGDIYEAMNSYEDLEEEAHIWFANELDGVFLELEKSGSCNVFDIDVRISSDYFNLNDSYKETIRPIYRRLHSQSNS